MNMVGRRIEELRKSRGIKQKDFIAMMQCEGCDINPTSYSKLEGSCARRMTRSFTLSHGCLKQR